MPSTIKSKRNLNGHVMFKNSDSIEEIFNRFAGKGRPKRYTRAGDTAFNEDGEDKSTGLTTTRYLILECLCVGDDPMTAAEIEHTLDKEICYSTIRTAMVEMTATGLLDLAVPPHPVVPGRRRPYIPTLVGRQVYKRVAE